MEQKPRISIRCIALIFLLVGIGFAKDTEHLKVIPQLDREKLPGRQVKVAAICIGFGGQRDEKLKLAIEHLHTAGRNGVDIACLPEEFAGTNAESVPGPTTDAVVVVQSYKTGCARAGGS